MTLVALALLGVAAAFGLAFRWYRRCRVVSAVWLRDQQHREWASGLDGPAWTWPVRVGEKGDPS